MVTVLDALKFAYRKHVLDDPSIDCIQVNDMLLSVLCNEMGNKEFGEWLDKITRNIEMNKHSREIGL